MRTTRTRYAGRSALGIGFPYTILLREAANRSARRPAAVPKAAKVLTAARGTAQRQDAPRRALLAHEATLECYDALQTHAP